MESAINNDRISISVTAWNEEGLAAAVRLQLHAVEDKSHPVLETESLTIGADGGATEFGARSPS